MFHAKNGTVILRDGTMDYIRFGSGPRALVMLPGLGDGLRSVKGTAIPMALMYRAFAKDFTVWAFSRKAPMPVDVTTRSMAQDVALAMVRLGIEKADIFGVSMGGMIAQWLAIDAPEKVDRLILAVTCARPNPILEASIEEWVTLARRGDHCGFLDSNLRRIYSVDYYRKNKWLIPLVGAWTKPGSYDRFFSMAGACLGHAAYGELHQIGARTLVLGGERDNALGGEGSREIAGRIPGAELKMYPQWGHSVYEEEKTFQETILAFLKR